MKPLILKHSLVIFLSCLGLLRSASGGSLPGDTARTPSILWINQWPSTDSRRNSHDFRGWFNTIILGKKIPVLGKPISVLAGNSQDYYVLDQGNGTIFRVRKGVGEIPHFVQSSGYSFSSLVGICRYSKSGFLVTDSHERKIYEVLPEEKRISVFNDSLELDQPTGIAISPVTNEVWVVETNAHRITVLDSRGKVLRRLGSRGMAAGEYNYPTHIWIDRNGLVYVVDAMNFRVQVLDPGGRVISVFGEPGDGSGFFARPKGIATDSHGNIYIVDALFHTIQAFDMKGRYLGRIGMQGHGEGEFWMPNGIYIDDGDYLYVADSFNSRIQVFQLVF